MLCRDRGLSSKHRTGSRDCNARRKLDRVGEVGVNREGNMAWGNLERERVLKRDAQGERLIYYTIKKNQDEYLANKFKQKQGAQGLMYQGLNV